MRGLIMVVMALDHVRDFWSSSTIDPTDASQTTPVLFATRWITHLCAPWFMLLAGAGAYLSHKPRGALARFLVSRGLWLIVLEFTIIKICWEGPEMTWTWYRLLVLWALGCSMIALAALQYLPRVAILAIAIAMIAGHNLLDHIRPDDLGAWSGAWKVIHVQAMVGAPPGEGWGGFVLYPLVPWIGVMALGYAIAPIFERERRARLCAALGVALLVVFVIVRAIDRYGDLVPWTHQATATRTVMSFLDVAKYPPSLDYLLATIGLGLILLAALEHLRGPVADVLRTIGRVPLFYYVLHLLLISTTILVAFLIARGKWPSQDNVAGWGTGLPGVYAIWIATVAALYLPCRWFAGVKQRRRDWWLGYL